jgi:hypothetical protein
MVIHARDFDDNDEGMLYGFDHPGAQKLAATILDSLAGIDEGGLVEVDLSGVRVLDADFAAAVYTAMQRGEHDRFCRERAGKGLVFSHVDPRHRRGILRALDEIKDVVAFADDEGHVEFLGAPFEDRQAPVRRVYEHLLDVRETTATDLQPFLKEHNIGSSLQNAHVLLSRLHQFGLLKKERRVAPGKASYRLYALLDYSNYFHAAAKDTREKACSTR